MSDCPSALALRLKISGKSLQESGDAGALKRAFRMACAKAATDFSNLAMVLTELAEDELELDALVATLDPSQVIFVIKGRDQDHGMALFDPAALSGLLEHVTTGRVSRGEIEPREPTNTDATIVADLLDRFLRRIAPELADITDPPSITGFAFSHILRDPSAVEMAFDNILYQRFTLGLDLDNGARQGQMVLIFPCAGTGAGQTKRDQVGNWATDWRQHVERVPVRLEAIFHRKKMALREISELSPGSIIQFPVAQLLHVQLRGTNGTLVAHGKLGQQALHRAIRISGTGYGLTGEAGDRAVALSEDFAPPGLATLATPAPPDTAQALPDLSGLAGGGAAEPPAPPGLGMVPVGAETPGDPDAPAALDLSPLPVGAETPDGSVAPMPMAMPTALPMGDLPTPD